MLKSRIFLKIESEIYPVNLRIQSEYGKIRTTKNSVFGHYSHSEIKNMIMTTYQSVLCHTVVQLL